MGLEADHIGLANRNHATLKHLLADPGMNSEWIATVAFYKAIQIVEAVLDAQAIGTTSGHRERKAVLKGDNRFQFAFRHYRVLWSASTVARYLYDAGNGSEYKTFADFMSPADVPNKLIAHRLCEVEQSMGRFLSPDGQAALIRF